MLKQHLQYVIQFLHTLPLSTSGNCSWKINYNPQWAEIIQPGLDKLGDYQGCLADTPAYVVAMGELTQVYIGLK